MMEMEHDEKIICECDGFTVRGWRGADVAQLAEAANDESVGRFLRDSFPYPYEEQDARRFIAVAARRRPLWDFAIEVDGRVAGGIGFVPQDDVGQRHAVEGVGLHHGVEGHVLKHQPVPFLQGLVEGVIPDDVPRQAGGAAQPVGIGLFPGLAAALEGRAVGHLQHIGHMAGGGGVQNGDIHAVFHAPGIFAGFSPLLLKSRAAGIAAHYGSFAISALCRCEFFHPFRNIFSCADLPHSQTGHRRTPGRVWDSHGFSRNGGERDFG